MRRFVALLHGLPPGEAAVWRETRVEAPVAVPVVAPPAKTLRRVNPLEAIRMLRGG